MDVKTAFLDGFLEEEMYMMRPEGFIDPEDANKVCKLQRSMYGRVQASRSWNICFDQLIKVYIPTPRCLHQSIDGSLELAHFVSTLGLTKPSGCIIYNSSLRNPLRNVVLISICQIS